MANKAKSYPGPIRELLAEKTALLSKAQASNWEGVTWFDHPSNPRYPTPWHVRDSGCMWPAFCLKEGFQLEKEKPLRLRYGFHIHAGAVRSDTAEGRRKAFAASPSWEVVKVDRPWRVRLRRAEK